MSDVPGKTTYTLAEAAALLSCHRETLRRAIHNGQLRAAKLGHGFRISRTDLESFWTACGGGSLFENSLEPADRGLAPSLPPKKKKDRGPHQLSFLSDPDDIE